MAALLLFAALLAFETCFFFDAIGVFFLGGGSFSLVFASVSTREVTRLSTSDVGGGFLRPFFAFFLGAVDGMSAATDVVSVAAVVCVASVARVEASVIALPEIRLKYDIPVKILGTQSKVPKRLTWQAPVVELSSSFHESSPFAIASSVTVSPFLAASQPRFRSRNPNHRHDV